MGELLKAVLAEQSISQRFKSYLVETGYVATAGINNITQDLIVNVQDDTVFLCQSFGVAIAYNQGAGVNQLRAKLPNTIPVLFQLADGVTRYKYFSGKIDSGASALASYFLPGINDRGDASTYYPFDGNSQIQASVNVNFAPFGIANANIGVIFVGVEYRFNQSPNLTAMEQLALQYSPPAKDQARAMSLDALGGVQGHTGQPVVSGNVTQTRAAIAAMQKELATVSAQPQTAQSGQYARYLNHRIAQLQASIQAANATV